MSDMSHQESVKPGDSASQTGKSSTSSTSRARVKAMVKRAALAAQAAALNEQQALELEEFKLKQRRSKLELQTRLSMAKAEEEVFSQHGESMTAAVDKDVSQQRGALTTEPSMATDLEKAVYQLRQPSQVQPNRVSTTDKDFSQRGERLLLQMKMSLNKEGL
ncbi:uncharacterized protein LOC105439504 [Strongylocentrotus purpuratus]|uniref:Uncharacterized protein n=1 Tax=Strongylocentrotus purpuratus TaxID=7668 RepID=A0A7M7HL07_STRPU|nr:uncharacterized protein LOC105439504 [Strongylocentrotus purpuratus]